MAAKADMWHGFSLKQGCSELWQDDLGDTPLFCQTSVWIYLQACGAGVMASRAVPIHPLESNKGLDM